MTIGSPLWTSVSEIDFIMLLLNPIVYRPAGQAALLRGNLSITPPSQQYCALFVNRKIPDRARKRRIEDKLIRGM